MVLFSVLHAYMYMSQSSMLYSPLKIDGTSLFLLILAQMTASGVQVNEILLCIHHVSPTRDTL